MPWPWIIGGAVVAGKLAYDWITRDDDDEAEAEQAAYQRQEQERRKREKRQARARSLVERHELNVAPEELIELARGLSLAALGAFSNHTDAREELKAVLHAGGAWQSLERELDQARARVRELERLQRRLAAED